MQGFLHQPYSHLVVCETKFALKNCTLSSLLCTDLAELHSGGSCPVQVSVVVHPSGWGDSEDCRTYILQHPNAAQQQQQAATGSHQPFGYYGARLKYSNGRRWIHALSHNGELKPFVERNQHTLVLQERVR
jgi:hypothetical protein